MVKHVNNLFYSYKSVWNASRFTLISQIFIKICLGFIPIISIWLIQELFNSITIAISTKDFSNTVYLLLLSIALINFFVFILNMSSNLLSKIMGYKFEIYMKQSIFSNAKKIPYIQYENSEFQNYYMRVLSAQSSILNIVESNASLIQTLISLTTIIFYLVKIDILFLAILAFMIFPLMFIQMRYGNQRYSLSVEMTEANRMNSYLESLLLQRETIKEIRINNLEDYYIKRWSLNFRNNSSKNLKLEVRQTKWLVASNLILVFSFILSGGYTFQLTIQGVLTIGVIAGVIQAIQSLQGIVPSLTANISNLYESSLFVSDYQSFAPIYHEKNSNNNRLFSQLEKVEMKNLSFKYPNQQKSTLKNVSISIDKGDKIAIMGGNGAGKTTLIKCLIGLYQTEKMIAVNNKYYLEELSKEDYWESLSVLFQDFNRYDLSVKDNISLHNEENVNMDKIRAAAVAVGMDDYINNLPLKYETPLGVLFKEGKELSGGQWQKIALARAFYKNADLLILDEPTSALDSSSEYYIIDNLLNKIEETAVIYITHRINVAMLADKIIIMESGTVVEEGSHIELLKNKGIYYDLYHKQLNYLTKEERGIPIG